MNTPAKIFFDNLERKKNAVRVIPSLREIYNLYNHPKDKIYINVSQRLHHNINLSTDVITYFLST